MPAKIKSKYENLMKSKDGSVYLLACIIMVCIMMVASFVWTYTEIVTDIRQCQDQVTSSMKVVVLDDSINQSVTRAFKMNRLDRINLNNYRNLFVEDYSKIENTVNTGNGSYTKYEKDGATVTYVISNIRLSTKKVSENKLAFIANYDLDVPIYFMGKAAYVIHLNPSRTIVVTINTGGTGGRGDG